MFNIIYKSLLSLSSLLWRPAQLYLNGRGGAKNWGTVIPVVYSWHTLSKRAQNIIPVYSWHRLSKCAQNIIPVYSWHTITHKTQNTAKASTLCVYCKNYLRITYSQSTSKQYYVWDGPIWNLEPLILIFNWYVPHICGTHHHATCHTYVAQHTSPSHVTHICGTHHHAMCHTYVAHITMLCATHAPCQTSSSEPGVLILKLISSSMKVSK